MAATLEWIVGIVRSGAAHNRLGDPFDFAATVVKEGDAAHIMGGLASGDAAMSTFRDCLRVLKKASFRIARWERIENGVTHRVEFDL